MARINCLMDTHKRPIYRLLILIKELYVSEYTNMSQIKGYEYYKAGNYQKAAEVFYSILEEEPNNARVWNLLGICLTKLEKYEVALTCFENALKLDSHNDIYLKNKQKCRHKLSQHVLHRVAMQPLQKKETTPVLISSPTKSRFFRSKIMYLFL